MNNMVFNIFDKILRHMRTRRFNPYIQEIKDSKDSIVVDFGCGEDMHFLKGIKNHIRLGIGIDNKYTYNENNLALSNIIIRQRLKQIGDSTIDLFTMIAVLEHLQYPEYSIDTLINAHRILKTGKKIVLTTPTPASKPILEFLAWLRIINKEEIDDHKHYYTKKELVWLLGIVGFKDIKHRYFQFGLNQIIEGKNGKRTRTRKPTFRVEL